MDIAKRFHQNPLLKPSDLQSGIEGMEITCFLNPGVSVSTEKFGYYCEWPNGLCRNRELLVFPYIIKMEK